MTEEEAKGLKEGDQVLVTFVVRKVETWSDGDLVIRGQVLFGGDNWSFSPKHVHSVLPRPLEVGDRVKHDEFGEGVLRYVEGDEAVMKVDPNPTFEGLFCVTLNELERVSQ